MLSLTHDGARLALATLFALSGTATASAIEETFEVSSGGKLVVERRNNFSGWWTRSRSLHIEVSLPDEFDVDLQTSGGSIDLDGTSGNADLKTSGGSVTVFVEPTIAVALDARTSGGRASSELPITVLGSASKDRLEGDINGGGPLLKLRSSGGSVSLRTL
ncbi:MAG: hypothetical protein ACC642_12000 [Pseudomonadales bacterium]